MGLLNAFAITASGMAVQQRRIDVTAENLANISSTRTPEGGPYRKKEVVVSSVPLSFDASLEQLLKPQDVQGVAVVDVVKSSAPPRVVYDPSHPDADASGNVSFPDINSTEAMVDMMTASKAYESNVTVFNAAKSMMLRALDIGGI